MSYLVIARKYRPQVFADLVGQEHVSVTLRNQIQSGRQAQAYLFTGPRGVGKTSAARILAKALRCLNRTESAEPCNTCAACQAVNDGSSIDVLEIDAASNTGVDNIRDLRENVNYSASLGHYRVYIVDEVHMLSTAAFNALLKTIEEPPPHVIFIFATTELHKVPATIQSRCQRFDFRRIPPDVMVESLEAICAKEKVEVEESALRILATESEGCLRDAQSLLDQALAFCGKKLTAAQLGDALGLMDRSALFELAQALGRHDPARALTLTHELLAKGTDPKIFLGRLVDFLSELHFRAFTGQSRQKDSELDAVLDSLAQAWSRDEIVRAMDLAVRTQAALNASLHAGITAEGLVVKLCLQRPVAASATVSAAPAAARPAREATRSSARPQASRESEPARPTTEARIESTPAPSSAVAPTTSSLAPSDARRRLEDFIRTQKPAWTPVMQSLVEIEVEGDLAKIVAKPDFAGKRLASADGQTLLKKALQVKQVQVDLEASQKKNSSGKGLADPIQEKRVLAREHEAVQAALKMFEASIVETKILEDEKASQRGKGVKR